MRTSFRMNLFLERVRPSILHFFTGYVNSQYYCVFDDPPPDLV